MLNFNKNLILKLKRKRQNLVEQKRSSNEKSTNLKKNYILNKIEYRKHVYPEYTDRVIVLLFINFKIKTWLDFCFFSSSCIQNG